MVPETYDFWLFDLDGTLVDTEWSYARDVFDRVGDRLGYEFDESEAEILWHGLNGARDPKLREWGLDPDEFWPVFHEEEDPQARAEATFLHDDAARLVDDIHDAGLPVGVVTHCQEFLTAPVLDHLDVRDWFDAVVCCTAETGWKPDPEPVRRAIGAMGLDDGLRADGGTAGVLAGDSEGDIGAAWNAGLDGIHVERHGEDHRGRCVLGDYRVGTFDELVRSR